MTVPLPKTKDGRLGFLKEVVHIINTEKSNTHSKFGCVLATVHKSFLRNSELNDEYEFVIEGTYSSGESVRWSGRIDGIDILPLENGGGIRMLSDSQPEPVTLYIGTM